MFNNKVQVQQVEHKPHESSLQAKIRDPTSTKDQQHNNNNLAIDGKDLEQLGKEAQELRVKTRKLQLEVDEKNEIINVLRDELETTKEQSDKFQRENLQLLKDAKRVAFLQDENDFLQDKVNNVDKLESELKRLKEKLQELDFLKIRISELEQDRAEAHKENSDLENKLKLADVQSKRVTELETEINKWKSYSQELETERDSIKSKLLESIENESRLTLANKKVDDEICRLKNVIKSYEDQEDVEQASNSLVMTVADIQQLDAQSQSNKHEQLEKQLQKSQSDIEHDKKVAAETIARYESELNLERVRVDNQSKRIGELESEIENWRLKSKVLSSEREALQSRLSEAVERESKLSSINRNVDDEIVRLKSLVKTYKELADENKSLKDKLDKRDNEFEELVLAKNDLSDELDSDRKTISNLRKDLVCEQNLTLKLDSQLRIFQKQIRSLEAKYPNHKPPSTNIVNAANSDQESQLNKSEQQPAPPTKTVTSTTIIQEAKSNSIIGGGNNNRQSSQLLVNGSQQTKQRLQQMQSSSTSPSPTSSASPRKTTALMNGNSDLLSANANFSNHNVDGQNLNLTGAGHRSNFVRNSMSTRSINPSQYCHHAQYQHHQYNQHQQQQHQHQQQHQMQLLLQQTLVPQIDHKNLNEQQKAHLENLHRQHLHHHLQHMYKAHQCSGTNHHPQPTDAQLNKVADNQTASIGHTWAHNLGSIKLNDRLAFASLRVPKSASGFHRQPQAVSRTQMTDNFVNERLQVNGIRKNGNNTTTNNQTNELSSGLTNHKAKIEPNKSAAYFEYGCV